MFVEIIRCRALALGGLSSLRKFTLRSSPALSVLAGGSDGLWPCSPLPRMVFSAFEDDEASHVQTGVLTVVFLYVSSNVVEKVTAFVNRKGGWLEYGEGDEEE